MESVQSKGFVVVDSATVMTTHITEIIKSHVDELLGRQEVQSILDSLAGTYPNVLEDLVPKVIPSDQDLAQIREAKAQAQAQQAKAAMQMQEMGAGAEIAAKLGGIDMEKDNVLKRMLGEKTPEKIEKAA